MALQMSWHPALHRRKSGPPLGLQNLGNTCYLNSVLQCLTYTPPLANFCLKNQHSSLCESLSKVDNRRDCPFCILERRIVRSLSIEASLDAPTKIQKSLRIFAEHFRSGRQEDAHEFLRYVIDACHNTCLKLLKSALKRQKNGAIGEPLCHDSIVQQIFGGSLQSQVKCLSCGTESNKSDEIMDISLDLFQTSALKEALRRFFQPEILDGSNKYNCESCKRLSSARKQMSVLQAPNILVIQLKRFEGILGSKIDRPITFEETLTLSSYMSKGSQDTRPEYGLFGTIVHSGYSQESGHYYAYVKDAFGRWYCCNDSHVSVSTLEEVLSEKVYILFFSRADQRPKSMAKIAPPSSTCAGVKHLHCNGNGKTASQKAADTSKPPKPIGSHRPLDVSAKPRIDSEQPIVNGHSGTSKRVTANGNGVIRAVGDWNVSSTGRDREFPKDVPGIEKMNSSLTSTTAEESGDTEKNVGKFAQSNGENYAVENKLTRVMDDGGKKTCASPDTHRNSLSGRCKEWNNVLISGDYNHSGVASNNKCDSSNGMPAVGDRCTSSKRKFQNITEAETCINLVSGSKVNGKYADSRSNLDRFKQALVKDASMELWSCGWVNEVHTFMRERKRLCAETTSNIVDLRNMLIGDAKQVFISQLPEALKGGLISRLRSFFKEQQISDA